MAEPETVNISSLDDLYYYFDLMEKSQVDVNSVEIALDSFLENFNFKLNYEDNLGRLNGTVDALLASSIVDFQEYIYSLYKIVKHQDADKVLSDDEKDRLRIYVKISDGSTEELIKNLDNILKVIFENMSGKQKIILLTLIATILTAGFVGDSYIDHLKSKAGEEQETERLKSVINGFTKVQTEINERPLYKEAIKNGQKALLKPVKTNDSYTFTPCDANDSIKVLPSDHTIDNKLAKELLKQKRNQSEQQIVTDSYYVKSIEALEDNNKYKVKLIGSSADIAGLIEIDASDEDIDYGTLAKHLHDKTAARLTVRTKTLNSVTSIDKLIATLTE